MAAKQKIGDKIRTFREEKKINIETLAFRSNLDYETIEQIEDNKQLPSLAPLIKIARSLGTNLSTFVDDTNQRGPIITLAEEKNKGANFTNKNLKAPSHMDFFALAANKNERHMEPYIIDFKPENSNTHKLSSHEGEEFICVLDGSVEINYGIEKYILNAGDSIYYDSIVNHNVHAYNNEPAKILAVIYIPT